MSKNSVKIIKIFQTDVAHVGCQPFRTQVISYLLWSFRTYVLVISYPVTTISYPGHVVPILVISYLGQLGTKWLHSGQFVPKLFRTHFGHFVPSKDGWMDQMDLALSLWAINGADSPGTTDTGASRRASPRAFPSLKVTNTCARSSRGATCVSNNHRCAYLC